MPPTLSHHCQEEVRCLPMALTHHSVNKVPSLRVGSWPSGVTFGKPNFPFLHYSIYICDSLGNFLCPDTSDRFLRRLRLTWNPATGFRTLKCPGPLDFLFPGWEKRPLCYIALVGIVRSSILNTFLTTLTIMRFTRPPFGTVNADSWTFGVLCLAFLHN